MSVTSNNLIVSYDETQASSMALSISRITLPLDSNAQQTIRGM